MGVLHILLRWRERKDTPPLSPLHEAHLLIIRIPKATAEIRREKGINAYGAKLSTRGAQ